MSVQNAHKSEQSPLVFARKKQKKQTLHIPLLTQVSVQLPPNIPGRCSPLRAWTRQTLHWAAGCELQGSSCSKQYTSGSSWASDQMAGACCTLGGLRFSQEHAFSAAPRRKWCQWSKWRIASSVQGCVWGGGETSGDALKNAHRQAETELTAAPQPIKWTEMCQRNITRTEPVQSNLRSCISH